MSSGYPVPPADAQGMLEVGDGHVLRWEAGGAPDGTPALWLHGGPGSGATSATRRMFDPAAYRAVLLDQRGSGLSTAPRDPAHPDDPVLTDLSANTTDHLVADVERLREHLGVDRWVVAGGSWGVTLALVYAQRHPDRVRALVLGAVTAGDADEIAWITREVGRIWPREWEAFASLVPDADLDDPCGLPAAYARLLADPDPAVRERAALAWCTWEDTHMSLGPDAGPRLQTSDPAFRLTFARLVTHYWAPRLLPRPGRGPAPGRPARRRPGGARPRPARRVRARCGRPGACTGPGRAASSSCWRTRGTAAPP